MRLQRQKRRPCSSSGEQDLRNKKEKRKTFCSKERKVFFYTIGNFISYRIKKDVDAHSARRQSEIARKLLPNGNRARRECAPRRTLFYILTGGRPFMHIRSNGTVVVIFVIIKII